MNDIPQNLIELEKAVLQLADKPGFQNIQCVINSVISLLGIDGGDKWKLFSDSNGKIRSNAGWFMLAEGFADKRASYKIADDNSYNLDIKAYWMKNISKAITSWLVALTPNFEDEPFFKSKNIGIDFIIPEKADRVIVVLSNNYVIRTLELFQRLSLTQKEIFHKWLQDFDFENKAQVHENLWHSFDLESVNKTFYKQISSFFVELKQHLADNKLFNERHAALFANRLIGRVIFCWFLDKKGFINSQQKYFELEGKNATEYYQIKLEKLFFRTLNKKIKDRGEDVYNLIGGIDEKTPFLNGGLFTPKEDDFFGVKHITFPADYFDRVYSFLKHYNFTTDESTSSFQQVAIDPEMLGRVFENLLAEQIEETGEQARKAKGAFYTPREIVEYMCKESLREYLKSKIEKTEDSEQRISQLLDSKPHEWRDQQRNYREKLKKYKYEILQALDEIKVVDPACGSGAFPMGMLQLLLQTYERLDPTFDSYKKKLEIIKNNLFGIDIEPMAVEIARLRSWLSIIVDEELNPNAENMGIHPLPNLEFKFVCANSLIPAPVEEENSLFEDSFFTELEQKAKEFFEINDVEKKEAKKHELRELVDCKVKEKLDNVGNLSTGLNIGKFEGEIKKKNQKEIGENIRLMALWGSYTNIFTADEPVGFFETKYFFPSAKDGFDVVIGNPPYVQLQKFARTDIQMAYSKAGYETFTKTGDLYCLFYERGVKMSKSETGLLIYITSNKWMRSAYGQKLRGFFARNNPLKLIDFGGFKVFDSAAVDTNILLIQNGNRDDGFEACHFKNEYKKGGDIKNYFDKHKIIFENPTSDTWFIGDAETIGLKRKIEKTGTPLKEWDVKIYRGILTGLNKAFVVDQKKRDELIEADPKNAEIIKPILRGRDIKRYGYDWSVLYLLMTGFDLDIPKLYPAIFDHLKIFEEKAKEREDQGKNWWNLRACVYYGEFEKEKVVWTDIATKPTFSVLEEGIYFNNTAYMISGANAKYLAGILNSLVIKFYFPLIATAIGGSGNRYFKQFVELLPIPRISASNKDLVEKAESFVDSILKSKKENPKADTSKMEAEIDQLVYILYELTDEEIEIIEGGEQNYKTS